MKYQAAHKNLCFTVPVQHLIFNLSKSVSMKQKFLLLLASGLLITGVFIACKKKTSDTGAATASITALNCSGATFSATATANAVYAATATVPYTGGNGASYSAGSAISSTGVTGLTATLSSGTLASGAGNLSYTVSGTPAASGTASFALSFGGQSCTLTLTVNAAGGSAATVTALNCSSATASSAATINVAYTGTLTVPYTGGNGIAYSAGTAISSTGVTGLTATLAAGTLANGAGNIVYNVSGTATSSGTASFAITFGGQSCTMALTVNATTSGCASQTGFAKLLCLCDAFKATLSTSQIATLQLSYTFANIKTWSNLPAAMSARLGIKLGDLNATQLTAAKAVIEAMSGTTVNEGYDEVKQLWLADDYLQVNGGGTTYGSGNYYLAFFGTPATTGQFEIMMTGHHKTVANTYNNGTLISGTPHFVATEPITWTSGGTTYAPVSQERDAFAALLAGLNSTQLAAALSSSTFSDIILGPNSNWAFPTAFSGYQCNGMTTAQKTLVMNAIKTYVNDIDDASAATILTLYESELDNTYILYKGSLTMTTQNDYFRIAGPHVWIEFHNPSGVILSGIHIHSIWRDRVNDYGTTH